MSIRGIWVTLLTLAATEASATSSVKLVTDVATRPAVRSAFPHGFVEMDGVKYYAASEDATGHELWRTDGTQEGTWLVRDIHPGPNGSLPRDLTVLGHELFFTAFDGSHGFALWKTDGTADGTVLVRGADDQLRNPGQLATLGSALLFTAGPSDSPRLWRSDGTSDGTQPVADLWLPGEQATFGPGRPRIAIAQGKAFLMTRADGKHALWCSDGTAGGTSRVWIDSAAPDYLDLSDRYVAFGTGLAFAGNTALWVTDGTPGGTVSLVTGTPAWNLTPASTALFFTLGFTLGFSSSTPFYPIGGELWMTDGTPAGTAPASGAPWGAELSMFQDRVYFTGSDGGLWSSDGTDPIVVEPPATNGYSLAVGADRLFLSTCSELLVTDGTPGAAVDLGPVAPAYCGFPFSFGDDNSIAAPMRASAFAGRTLLPLGAQPGTAALTLGVSDATVDGTHPILGAAATRGSDPREVAALPSSVLFTIHDDSTSPFGPFCPNQLWSAPSGLPATAIYSTGGCLGGLTSVGDRAFFVEALGATGRLLRTDGTAAGTRVVAAHASKATPTLALGGLLLFYDDNFERATLKVSDGTSAGTHALPARCADMSPFLLFQGRAYFLCDDTLWRTNGTSTGTTAVGNVPGAMDVAAGDYALYVAAPGALWISDGSRSGTHLVAQPSLPTRLAVVGSRAFFTEASGDTGRELWTSDGTTAGTHMVADIRPGPESSNPDGLVAYQRRLFFTADDGLHGRELWTSDGALVRLVADLAPGATSGLEDGPILEVRGGLLYFRGYRPDVGVELFSATLSGVTLEADINPGPASSYPALLGAPRRSEDYIAADDGTHGRELFRLFRPRRGLDPER